MTTYYEELGIGRSAPLIDVKKAYHRLAWTYHPDRNGGAGEATEKFKRISETYSILSNDSSRRDYDQSLPLQQTSIEGRSDNRRVPTRSDDRRALTGTLNCSQEGPDIWYIYRGGRAPTNVIRARAEGVAYIADGAFSNCPNLKAVDLPDVVTIGEGSFRDCTELEHVVFSDSLRKIGAQAFAACKSLKKVDLKNVEDIGEDAFRWCDSLVQIKIPLTVTTIGPKAFCYCTKLKEVRPASGSSLSFRKRVLKALDLRNRIQPCVTSVIAGTLALGEGVFSYCRALERVEIPPACSELARDSFYGCTRLRKIDLSNVTTIRDAAFHDCSSMKHVHIPSTVREIGACAFSGCKALKAIDLARTKIIKSGAFYECLKLKRISMPYAISIGDGAFRWCISLKSIEIPPAVADIGRDAFHYCTRLEQVVLHEGLGSIGENAFWKCSSLRAIAIPSSVTCISSGAFGACEELREVHLREGGILTIERNSFGFCCRRHPDIIVPCLAYVDGPTTFRGNRLFRTGTISNADGWCGTTIVSRSLGSMLMAEQPISNIFALQVSHSEKLEMIRDLIFYHEVQTVGVTILELAIWKANIDHSGAGDHEARQACRQGCGSDMNIIINGVLQFFKRDR